MILTKNHKWNADEKGHIKTCLVVINEWDKGVSKHRGTISWQDNIMEYHFF